MSSLSFLFIKKEENQSNHNIQNRQTKNQHKQQQKTVASLTCRVCGLPFLTVCCPHALQISPYPVQKWSPYTFKPRRKNFRVCRELKFQLHPAHPPEILNFFCTPRQNGIWAISIPFHVFHVFLKYI